MFLPPRFSKTRSRRFVQGCTYAAKHREVRERRYRRPEAPFPIYVLDGDDDQGVVPAGEILGTADGTEDGAGDGRFAVIRLGSGPLFLDGALQAAAPETLTGLRLEVAGSIISRPSISAEEISFHGLRGFFGETYLLLPGDPDIGAESFLATRRLLNGETASERLRLRDIIIPKLAVGPNIPIFSSAQGAPEGRNVITIQNGGEVVVRPLTPAQFEVQGTALEQWSPRSRGAALRETFVRVTSDPALATGIRLQGEALEQAFTRFRTALDSVDNPTRAQEERAYLVAIGVTDPDNPSAGEQNQAWRVIYGPVLDVFRNEEAEFALFLAAISPDPINNPLQFFEDDYTYGDVRAYRRYVEALLARGGFEDEDFRAAFLTAIAADPANPTPAEQAQADLFVNPPAAPWPAIDTVQYLPARQSAIVATGRYTDILVEEGGQVRVEIGADGERTGRPGHGIWSSGEHGRLTVSGEMTVQLVDPASSRPVDLLPAILVTGDDSAVTIKAPARITAQQLVDADPGPDASPPPGPGSLGLAISVQADNSRITLEGGDIQVKTSTFSPITSLAAVFAGGSGTEASMTGGAITTEGPGLAGLRLWVAPPGLYPGLPPITTETPVAGATLTLSGGAITTRGDNSIGVNLFGVANPTSGTTVTLSGSEIRTEGENSAGVSIVAAELDFTLSGGAIATGGDISAGLIDSSINGTLTLSGGAITTEGAEAHGVVLIGAGPAALDGEDNTHRLTMTGGTVRTSGAGAIGVLVTDAEVYWSWPDGAVQDSLTELRLGGDIEVSGEGAWGVYLEDPSGGVSLLEVSGRIAASGEAAGAIYNFIGLPLTLNLISGADVEGDIVSGTGDDVITLSGDAAVTGDLNSEGGDDQVRLSGNARITGNLNTGPGDDTVSLADRAAVTGLIDGGEDDGAESNTLDLRSLQAGALNYRNFAEVLGVVSGGAAVFEGGRAVLTLPGEDGGRQVVVVEETEVAAPAILPSLSVATVSSAVHGVAGGRLAGAGATGPRAGLRRPVQVAANALLPGLLHAEARPLVWGEVFAADRQRGRDGTVPTHQQDYWGVAFGLEQDYGDTARAGLLFGYASSDLATPRALLRTEADSFFAGLYGQLPRGLLGEQVAIGLGLNLGYEDYDSTRSLGTGGTAVGSYHNVFLSPALRLTLTHAIDTRWSLQPALDVSYTLGWYDGYTERGAEGLNQSLSDRTARQLRTRLGLAGIYALPEGAGQFTLRAGLDSRFTDNETVGLTLAGVNFRISDSTDDSVHTAFVGAALRLAMDERWHVNLGVEYHHDVGEVSERALNGRLQINYAF